MEVNKRTEWVDSLRGFTIILVLFGHTPNSPFLIFKWLSGFVLPLFFTISGYLFSFDKWKKSGIKSLISKKAKSYLLPFVSICLVIFGIEITKTLIFNHSIYWPDFFNYCINYIKWILFQITGEFNGSLAGGLWFLPTLFFSIILLYILLSFNNILKLLFIIFSALIVYISCHYSLNLPWHIDVAFLGTMYMYCGYIMKRYDLINRINKYIAPLLFVIATLMILNNDTEIDLYIRLYSNYFLMLFGGVLMSFFFIYSFKELNVKSKSLQLFGKYSIFVIAGNFIVNYLLTKLLDVLSIYINWIVFAIIEIFIFLFILLFIERFLYKNKAFRYLFTR